MITDSLFNITSILCFSLPILVIVLFRLYRHLSLIALVFYYALTLIHCLFAQSIPPVPNFANKIDVLYGFIELPLLLASLLFFCGNRQGHQFMKNLIAGFMIYELLVALYFKFAPEAIVYIMAPGLLVVLGYATFLFVRQVKFTFVHVKNPGRVVMLSAILFSYSCYAFVFYAYFIQHQTDVASIYYMYFVSSTIASVLMSIGLFMMRHRIKELQELKVVRKELQMVFGG
ncbi:MAG: hypothetical protein M3Y85_11405 [Bacteroidota bacterium]|nr:hypothetical protein [Bacteroidota bacterium]